MAKEIPFLKTDRLLLRNIKIEDTSEIVHWRSDPKVFCYFKSPHAITVEEHLNWFNNSYLQDNNRYDWMAVDKDNNLIGIFGLIRDSITAKTAEINFIIAPRFRGLGYAREAIKELLDFAENVWSCDNVIAEIHENNLDSIKVATRLGMELASRKNWFLVYKIQLSKNMKDKKTIFIRVDGNPSIGTGHVMRCLSIAEQIRNNGIEVVFITADNTISGMIQNNGFTSICLDSNWNDLDYEIDKLCTLINEKQKKLLLIDSYFVTEEYLKKLKENVKVFYIDDLNFMEYPVNSLINYNIYGKDIGYNDKYYEHLYLGPKYAPLRDEFNNCYKRDFKGINNILITSGGTDKYNVVGNILEYLVNKEEFSSLNYYCILGRFNKNINQLNQIYGTCENIHFLIDINNMSYYMKKCDIAITAGGTTCYELCACGVPSIIYTLADNQFGVAKSFSQKGIIPYVGDVRENMAACMENLADEIKKLVVKENWDAQSKKMQDIVDGKGAYRIAQVLMENIGD